MNARGRCFVATAVALGLLGPAACGGVRAHLVEGRETPPLDGDADAGAAVIVGPRASADPAGAPAVSPAEALALPEARAERPISAHGGGAYAARIRASTSAVYREGALPAGARICAEHRRMRDGAAGPLTCMRRSDAGWDFAVALSPFRAWEREGALADCAGCHSGGVLGKAD